VHLIRQGRSNSGTYLILFGCIFLSGCFLNSRISGLDSNQLLDSSSPNGPTVTLTTNVNETFVSGVFQATAEFSETVSGMNSSAVLVNNGSLSNFKSVSGSVYTFDVTPTAEGNTIITLPSGLISNSAGATMTLSASVSKYYDIDPIKANFLKAQSVLTEGNSSITGVVTLSAPKPYPISLALDVFGSAPVGTDHNMTAQTITIPAYATSANFSFNLFENGLNQGDRNLGVAISSISKSKVSLGTTPITNYFIQDNDGLAYKNVTDVVMGYDFTCARLNTGDVKCWGSNSYGSLGIGNTTSTSTPTLITGLNFNSITAGSHSGCGITSTNVLKCWGANWYGEIGDGSYTQRNSPATIDGGVFYKKIDLGGSANGGYTTCGITSADDLKCWGDNNYSQYGDGLGTYNSSLTPIIVHAGTKYKEISIGGLFACAIQTSGALECWGTNWNGQLGIGTYNDADSPVIVDAGNQYAMVSAGGYHTCGITTTGVLKCWGLGKALGTGDTNDRLTPTEIDIGTTYAWVGAGEENACAITTSGILKCWGNNEFGQIGDLGVMVSPTTNQLTPLAVDTGTIYSKVMMQKAWAGGSSHVHACAVTTTGSLNCWGDNSSNQLALNLSTNLPQIASGLTLSSLVADSGAFCGQDFSSELYCWGTNSNFVFRENSASTRARPYASGGTKYASVSIGNNVGCGITSSGVLQCWGYNQAYELADGTTTAKYNPVIIDAGTTYSMVSANFNVCAITTSGVLKCWGYNAYGQVGDGTTVTKTSPVTIDVGTSYSYVSTSGYTTCAITTIGGVLKCWGYNLSGALGNGTTTNSNTPIIINSGTAYSSVATTILNSCGITTVGALRCWGNNLKGQVGNGSTTATLVPVTIAGTYSKVSMGSQITCALNSTNDLYCWGNNATGDVGDGTLVNKLSPTLIDGGTKYSSIIPSTGGTCGLTQAGLLKCWGNQSAQVSGLSSAIPTYVRNLQQ